MDASKFDKMYDLEGLKEDVEEAEKNGNNGEYPEIPDGDYEVSVDELELTESKKGLPMIKIWYTIVEGKYENQKLFQYQLVDTGKKLNIAMNFLKGFKSPSITRFVSYSNLAKELENALANFKAQGIEFLLNKKTNKKGFTVYKIEEVYDPKFEAIDDEEIPF